MKARNYLQQDHPYAESKTARQWVKEHRIVNADAIGETFWTNANHPCALVYYRKEDTHVATESEMEEERMKARAYRKELRERKKAKALAKVGSRPN